MVESKRKEAHREMKGGEEKTVEPLSLLPMTHEHYWPPFLSFLFCFFHFYYIIWFFLSLFTLTFACDIDHDSIKPLCSMSCIAIMLSMFQGQTYMNG